MGTEGSAISATVDGIKVAWDRVDRIYLCSGHGYSFRAWFAGTPPVVEAEVFAAGMLQDSNLVAMLYAPAPDWPAAVPSAEEVAIAFGRQPKEQLAAQGDPT